MNENMKTKITVIVGLNDGDKKEIIRTSNNQLVDFFAEVMEECREVIGMQPEETHIFLDDVSGTALLIKREDISYIEILRKAEVMPIKDPHWGII